MVVMPGTIRSKPKLIQIRSTEEVWGAVKKHCRRSGITVSEFFRRVVVRECGCSDSTGEEARNDTPEKTLEEMWWEE